LPAGLPAAVLVVLHVPASGGSSLPGILDRAGPLPAAAAADGEPIQPGRARGHALSARRFSEAAREARQSADAIREVVNTMTAEVATAPGSRALAYSRGGQNPRRRTPRRR
jgi:chemotaxis response regulator CheB